jgi:hypothetical protein
MNQYPPQEPPSNVVQPGYPPQPGYLPVQLGGYPPAGSLPYPVQPGNGVAPPPLKRGMGLWIAIVIIVMLLLGGGGAAYFVIQGQSSPTATLQRYCDGIKNKNAQEVYDTISSSLQQKMSLSAIQQNFAQQQDYGIKVTDCTVSDVQQTGSVATGIITITTSPVTQSKNDQISVDLIQENGQWKINVILPCHWHCL